VDDIRYCPLAPTIKDPTIIEDLMRKPGPGMLLEAAHTLGLHLAESWMVGDTVSDMLAGRHAGTRTILVETGYGAAFHHDKASVDHVVADLSEAVARILNDACG
jgi:D-glycero-D-manno-heptose 1,7-bisphosphate phosphatase